MAQALRRLKYNHLVMTDNFISWVKHQVKGDPSPMLDKIRQAFVSHQALSNPPFHFEQRDASMVCSLPTMPGLYLFVSMKPNGKLKIIGGRFFCANAEKIGFNPLEFEDIKPPGEEERERVLRYLLKMMEACEYAEDQEILEKAIRDIRGLEHHKQE